MLADSAFGYDELGGDPLRYVAASGMLEHECVFSARIERSAVNDKVTLRDYDFERPMLDLTAEASSGSDAREHHEHPGGHRSPDVGRELAQIRLEELQQRQVILTGRTNARRLFPGVVLKLAEAPREDMNGSWLVVELEHEARIEQDTRTYVARFTAVPGGGAYRPARRPAPRHGGVHNAVITGRPIAGRRSSARCRRSCPWSGARAGCSRWRRTRCGSGPSGRSRSRSAPRAGRPTRRAWSGSRGTGW